MAESSHLRDENVQTSSSFFTKMFIEFILYHSKWVKLLDIN